MSKVSVIVPVYNVENYINRCVDSLLNQTLCDIDIILVDDGSTDNSAKIIDDYANTDNRIKVIHKLNAGQGFARNDGMNIATGKYICFLDSDDYYEKDACEYMYNQMENHGADMLTFGYQIDSPDGKCIRSPRIIDRIYENEDITQAYTLHFYGDDPSDDNLRGYSSCMTCFSAAMINDNNLNFLSEREVLSEDNLFCLECCRYAKKVVTASKILYHYCQKADSFSQGYSEKRMPMTKLLCNKFREYAKEFGVDKEAEIRIAGLIWINMMATIKQDVRRLGTTTKKQIKDDIRILCNDKEFRTELVKLKGMNLPLKQKLFLQAYLNKWVNIMFVMAQIRAKERI